MSHQAAAANGRIDDNGQRSRRARRVRVPRTLALLVVATLALVAFAVDGAERAPAAVQELQDIGVSFDVPADWELMEDGEHDVLGVGLASPDGTATLSVDRHVHSGALDVLDRERRIADDGRPPRWATFTDEDVTVDGRHGWRRVEEGPRAGGEQPIRAASLVLDAGDGTIVSIRVAAELSADDHDAAAILASVADTLTIDDAPLPDARRLTVSEDGIEGEYWVPDVRGPHPAILVVGGSEGGYSRGFPSLFARAGHPALSLAYWTGRPARQDLPDLPTAHSEIPLEYFEAALLWLADQPEVDPERIYVRGVSRGGEGALLIAATYPELVHGVIATVPGNVVVNAYPRANDPASGWSLDGEPVPFVPHTRWIDLGTDDVSEWEIPVERFDGPILLTCGELDELWPSCPMSRRVVERLEEHGYPHRVDLLAYPDLGHGVNLPHRSLTSDPRDGDDAWQRSLEFIDETS